MEQLDQIIPPPQREKIARGILRIVRRRIFVDRPMHDVLRAFQAWMDDVLHHILDIDQPLDEERLEAWGHAVIDDLHLSTPVVLEATQTKLLDALEAAHLEAREAVLVRFIRAWVRLTRAFEDARERWILERQASIQEALFRSREQIEQQLRESEARYRSLVELSPDAVILHHNGTILYANQTTYRMLGIPQDGSLLGASIYTSLKPEYRRKVEERVRQVQEEGKIVPTMREVLQRPDGSEIHIEVAAAPVIYKGKRVVLVVARDVTERVRVENELNEARARLAQAQEQERLRLAQELHDDVIQSLVVMRFSLKHIQQQVQALEGSEQTLQSLHLVQEQIRQVTDTLRHYVRELRPAGLHELGLKAALQGYLERVAESATEEGIHIHIDIQPPPAHLREPVALALFRAAQEGVRNALKHAAPTNVWVSLRFDDRQAVLLVRDDGIGFRVPKQLSEFALQDHFGLVGVQERVAWVGGSLEVESVPGQGTRYAVYVPVNPSGRPAAVIERSVTNLFHGGMV
nr:PAS domain-containing sensor histidine kinase [Ardenticatena sp.]